MKQKLVNLIKGAKLRQGQKYDPNDLSREAFKCKLELQLISLLEAKDKAKAIKELEPFLQEVLGATHEFVNDIEVLKKHVGIKPANPQARKKYTIEDTDHWEDLLLVGTDVSGSCQRITGDVFYNKCLLGYIADGKNRVVVVKDEKGRIIARCIMRLLWDEKNQTPVLFQERLYHNLGVTQNVIDAIDILFKERAKALGVPLVRTKTDSIQGGIAYSNNLVSLGNPAPFEYVDGGNGLTNGRYIILARTMLQVAPSIEAL